jgi:hypothetical protein
MQLLVHLNMLCLRSWASFEPRRASPWGWAWVQRLHSTGDCRGSQSVTMTSCFALHFIFPHSQSLAANLKIADIVYELQQNWFYTWLLHLPTNLFWWSPTSILPNFTIDKISFCPSSYAGEEERGKSNSCFDWSCMASRRIPSAQLDGG